MNLATHEPATLQHSATARISPLIQVGDWWLMLLCIVLCGYALTGRGFAYLGVPPLFIGELTLLAGLAAMMCCSGIKRLFSTGLAWLIVLFCIWGTLCTIPYLKRDGVNALRDGVAWGYSAFALISATIIISQPRRLALLEHRYRLLIKLLLILGPISWLLTFKQEIIPTVPGTTVPIVDVKAGDQAVHLTGAYAYLMGAAGFIPQWIVLVLLPLNLGLNVASRAAMATFTVGAILIAILLPLRKLTLRLIGFSLIALTLVWGLNLRYAIDGNPDRDLSVDQIVNNILSTFSSKLQSTGMEGTKQWRLNWWHDIIGYTFNGKYFWTGKGFGINLANDDGYQVYADNSLRNPHSAHMMYLARGGVPMLVLWITLQAGWGLMVARAYLISRRNGQQQWKRIFAFLLTYWVAFLINASFDVFLEGPMGGIWFWTIFGIGIASLYIHKTQPQVMEASHEDSDRSQLLSAAGR